MIIARASRDATEIIILGLTKRNVEKLIAGQPVHVRNEVHGKGIPPGWEIIIAYGETEKALFESMKPAIGPDTKIEGKTEGLV